MERITKDEQRIDIAEILREGKGAEKIQFVVEQWHDKDFPKEISERGFEKLWDPDSFPEKVGEPDLGEFLEKRRRNFHALADACRMYYTGYIISDPFGKDETKRVTWQQQMLQEYGEKFHSFQRQIKLRLGPITGVLGLFRSLVDNLNTLNIHTEESDKVRALFDELPSVNTFRSTPDDPLTYTNMSYERKLEIVRKIDSVAARFLALVTQEAAPEQKVQGQEVQGEQEEKKVPEQV